MPKSVNNPLDGILLITGGTGSFGHAVLRRYLPTDIREIRIFSRDEKKQDDMRRQFNNQKVKFYLGDVREREGLRAAMRNVDYVFHAAALKQVPSCEFHPMQAVQTNILGTENVLATAVEAGVQRVVCLSTDKAVYPINAMGISKAMMEKVMIAASRNAGRTIVCGTRYGNVMASRGSVIPLFLRQMLNGRPVTVTDPKMTRFMMTLEDAVDLVHYAFKKGQGGDIFVQKAPAATVKTLVEALSRLLGLPNYPIAEIGTRHGEKLYESLLSREERAASQDLGDYFRVPQDDRDLNYGKYIEEGERSISQATEYTSHNTNRLNVEEMMQLLLKIEIVQRALAGELTSSED